MNAGDCFCGAFRIGQIKHYWIVLCDCDANGEVLIVNFTTPKFYSPKAHVVSTRSFTTLQHDSEVAWGFAMPKEAAKIREAINQKLFTTHPGMSKQQLEQLIADGDAKKLIPKEIRKRL